MWMSSPRCHRSSVSFRLTVRLTAGREDKELFNLTQGYFGDLMKKDTGKRAHEILLFHINEVAKHRLADANDDKHHGIQFRIPLSQYFTRTFKRITGQSLS